MAGLLYTRKQELDEMGILIVPFATIVATNDATIVSIIAAIIATIIATIIAAIIAAIIVICTNLLYF